MTNGNHPSLPAKRRILSSIIGFLAVVCLGTPARADDGSLTESATPSVNVPPRVYLTLAVGGISGVGPAGLAAFTVGGDSLQVTARASRASELNLLGSAYNTMTEYGLMFGGGKTVGVTRFYTTAGVGTITMTHRGREIPYDGDGWHTVEYETVTQSAFNVPLQVGLDFGARAVSAGVAFVANLNTVSSYAGLLFTLNLGSLRNGT